MGTTLVFPLKECGCPELQREGKNRGREDITAGSVIPSHMPDNHPQAGGGGQSSTDHKVLFCPSYPDPHSSPLCYICCGGSYMISGYPLQFPGLKFNPHCELLRGRELGLTVVCGGVGGGAWKMIRPSGWSLMVL